LNIVASQDLGGLGDQNGPAVSCSWSPPSRVADCLPLFVLSLLLWIMIAWATVFGVMSLLEGPGPWLEMAMAWVAVSIITGVLWLPFLMLSWFHGFFRERLKVVLGLTADDRLASAAQPANLPH
jgi:hypothetical protein